MAKIKIPKLKLKLWQELVYFAFIAIIPAVITCIEIFSSHSTVFQITFSSVGSVLLVITILKKFVFNDKINKLKGKCILLEHDYSIEVGNKDNIKHQWGFYNAIIYAYNVVTILFSLVLFVLFVTALSSQLLAFRGASIIILSSVVVGLVWKFVLFIRVVNKSHENTDKQV